VINPQKVKITFVGDQALLKKQSKPGVGGFTQKQSANIIKQASQKASNQKAKIIQFHRDSSRQELESMSNSGTECQPSPIIQSKRFPQKMVPQINGDQSISPPNSRGTKNVFGIKKNNFVGEGSNMASPAGFMQNQNKMVDPNIISDYEESHHFSPHMDQKN
jgi:hypothetical protein